MTQEPTDNPSTLESMAEQTLISRRSLEQARQQQDQESLRARTTVALHSRGRKLRRWALLLGWLAAYLVGTVVVLKRYADTPVERPSRAVIRGDWFYRGGDKFLVKAVGWDPARPGELPWARRQSVSLVDDDFRRIRQAGFNTIRSWEALTWPELVAAERHDLAVLQGIWIEPDGDFASPEFQRRALQKIRDIVGYSKESRAVIGYLVMNEPEAAHVQAQGVEVTRKLLRLLAAEMRRLDPVGLVAFANWPGVEFLAEPDLDFAAANLYPFRPQHLLGAVGYEGMVHLWKSLHGAGRPLLVTEFGLSVSPQAPTQANAPGGATEEEQARHLPLMADQLLAAGAAGSAVFAWNDGWWKGQDRAGDEQFHDPDDAEEWFGLLAMEKLQDLQGRARPALEAMRRWNRLVVTAPINGPVNSRSVLLEMHAENETDLQAAVSLNQGEAVAVPLVRQGPWYRGWIGLALDRSGAQVVEIFVYDKSSTLLRRLKRTVYPPGQQPQLTIELTAGNRLVVRATNGQGAPLPNAEVRLALTSATGTHDWQSVLYTDSTGTSAVSVSLPDQHGAFVAAGLWLAGGDTPAAVTGRWLKPLPPD